MSLMTKVGVEFVAKNRANSQISSFNRSIARMGRQLLMVAGVGGGLYAFKRGFSSVTSAAMEQEKAERALSAAINQNISQFKTYAAEMQKQTIYGDEAVLSQMAYAANLGVTTDKLKEATTAAIGLAAKYRIDLASAMMLVGRASQGQTQMLTRYGIVIDQNLSTQEKFNELLRIGADSFRLAKEAAKDSAGQMEQYKNAMGDIKETIGEPLLGVMKDLSKLMVDNKSEIQSWFKVQIDGWKEILSGMKNVKITWDSWLKSKGMPGVQKYGQFGPTIESLEALKPKRIPVKPMTPQDWEKVEKWRALKRREKMITEGANAFLSGPMTGGIQSRKPITAAQKQARIAVDIVAAQRAMFRDMKRMTTESYNFRLSVIKDLKDKYIESGIARQNVDLWYVEQAKKLDIERLRSGSSMYGGLQAAAMQMQLEIKTLGDISYDAAMTFQNGFGGAFADVIMRIQDVDDAFRALAISVARSALSMVGQNIAGSIFGGIFGFKTTVAPTGSYGGPSAGFTAPTGHNGIPSDYFPRLHGGLGADEFPAIIQRGEEIIPKSRTGGRGGDLIIRFENRGTPQDLISSNQQYEAGERIINIVIDDAQHNGPVRRMVQDIIANEE